MDLRIVNTCNNNCKYCLEQSLRKKENFISVNTIYTQILAEKTRDNITFYWWNTLLHPDILKIVDFCFKILFKWIWLLSNMWTLDKLFLDKLKEKWLNNFWFYFNSFNQKNHELINWYWISYKEFLENLDILSNSWIYIKAVIHINNLNIDTIARDLIILKEKYWVNDFDFINYFPFERPYTNRHILEYKIIEKRKHIDNIFLIIKKLHLKVNFLKFSRDFFWDFIDYYDYEKWILSQIWKEDIKRLSTNTKPICLKEKRCEECFIKDNCTFYEL